MRGGDEAENIHLHRRREGEDKGVARGPRRGPLDAEPLLPGEAKLQRDTQGHRTLLGAHPKAEAGGKVRRTRQTQNRINVKITLRRVNIDPEEKRAQYLARLEGMIVELNELLCNRATIRSTRLKAMDTMIKALKCCYTIVRDVDIEVLRHDIEELKESAEQADVDFAPLDEPQGPP